MRPRRSLRSALRSFNKRKHTMQPHIRAHKKAVLEKLLVLRMEVKRKAS